MSDSPSSQGRNAFPLHDAAYHGDALCICEIAHTYVDVDVLNEDGRTALHIAARLGHIEAVRALLEMGADVNVRDLNNNTALHIAASVGHTEVVRVLIEEGGVDVMARSHGGNTALHYASKERRVETAEFLMSIYPSLADAVDDDGLTPIELATERGYDDVVRVLGVEWSESSARALHIVASEGNEAIIRSLTRAEGSDVNARDEQGDTALHLAADQGHTEAIRTLIELGADVAAVNIDNETPLHVALGGACFGTVSALLHHHAAMCGVVDSGQQQDCNAVRGQSRETALHAAARHGKSSVVEALIDCGCDVSAVDGEGNMALHLAVSNSDRAETVTPVLLSNMTPTEVFCRNNEGLTAMCIAAREHKIDVITGLLDATQKKHASTMAQLLDATHCAALRGHLEVCNFICGSQAVESNIDLLLRQHKPFVSEITSSSAPTGLRTAPSEAKPFAPFALHLAAAYGRTEIVHALIINCRVPVNVRDRMLPTPLHHAARFGHTETVSVLIREYGADVNAADRSGKTPLHYAATNGHTETASVLIREHDADINAVDRSGKTPLHYAATNGHTETVSVLIQELGANVYAGDNDGMTALHSAASNGRTDMVSALIREHDADVNAVDFDGMTPLHWAARRGEIDAVSVLIREFGADVNAVDFDGMTPLHYAASNGHTKTVSVLFREHGADVNAVDNNGMTPLHHAATNGHTETISVLIREHGANVNAVDRSGKTPLHSAASNNHSETVSALVWEHGVKVTAADGHGNTPLQHPMATPRRSLSSSESTARMLMLY